MITLCPLYDTAVEEGFIAAVLGGNPGATGSTSGSPQSVLQLTWTLQIKKRTARWGWSSNFQIKLTPLFSGFYSKIAILNLLAHQRFLRSMDIGSIKSWATIQTPHLFAFTGRCKACVRTFIRAAERPRWSHSSSLMLLTSTSFGFPEKAAAVTSFYPGVAGLGGEHFTNKLKQFIDRVIPDWWMAQ